KAGPDYRLTGWLDSCPGRYLEQYARLRGRMSTEVPLGGTDYRAEAWDGARVRRSEDELRRQGGHALVAAVEHLPGDGLAGYTFAEYSAEKPRVLYQEATLVLPAPRGRGLALLLKAANLLRIMDHWPAGRSLYTWNAAENSPMLGINTALGFVPAGCEAAWQKRTGGPQGSPPGPDLVGRGAFP
ncbi:GNAT family N-acetyltransferase, partial [Arthrobacter deserti]|nr:GNAT family N-acetyltransferase [Arthrobacter deserti]